jgi:hypothetical protein
MGAVAAARRTQSSFATYLASTNPSDLVVSTGTPTASGGQTYDPTTVRTLSHLPHVKQAESFAGVNNVLPLGPILGPNGVPVHTPNRDTGTNVLFGGSVDGLFFNQDRLIPVQGRMASPKRADEVVMTEDAAHLTGAQVGDSVPLGFYSLDQGNLPGYGTAPVAPYVRMTVKLVGIVVPSESLVRDDIDRYPTNIYLTPALTRRLTTCCSEYARTGLQLDSGSRAVATVEAEVQRVLPGYNANFIVPSLVETHAQQAIEPESIALGVFGGIASLAALLIIGQVMSRQLRLGATERRTIRALGASRAMTMMDALFGVVGAIIAGSLFAVGVAICLSPLGPIGPVRPVYPTPGVAFDWTVLGVGFLLLVLVLSVLAVAIAARQAPHRAGSRLSREPGVESNLARRVAHSGLSIPAVIGIRFALDPGARPTGTPVRSAIFGTALAVTILVSTLTFGSSLNALVSHPSFYGWNWNYALQSAFGGAAGIPQADAAPALNRDIGISAWTGAYYFVVQIDGQTVPVLGLRPHAPIGPPVLSGHGLDTANEVVLGTATLTTLHKRVGDSVVVRYGSARPRRLRIAGTATLPAIGSGGVHTSMGTGAVLTASLLPTIVSSSGPNVYLVDFRAGANPATTLHSLHHIAQNLSQASGPVSVLPVQRPAEIVNYRSMGTTPALLGVALAVGAALGLVLTLIATVRRRRRDFALLKTLGLAQRQVASVVAWQSSIAVAIGILVGVPLGIVLGRSLWDVFAHDIHVVPAPSVPDLVILLIVVGALVLANMVAYVPGRIAARTPTALLLRAE